MTGKQKAMIVERLKDPTATNSEIIRRAGYNAKTVFSQSQQYLENMKNPEIASRLEPVVDEIEDALITTVRRYKNSKRLPEVQEAMNNARWIHDKVRGKATQRIEQHSTSVNLSLSLADLTTPPSAS